MVHCSKPLHRIAEKHGRMEAKTFASVAFAAVAPVVAPVVAPAANESPRRLWWLFVSAIGTR